MEELVLVTGASGFIGQHLCSALAARGRRVRALYRRKEAPPELAALAEGTSSLVELFRADLGDADRVREALLGARSVIHVAALASDWGSLETFMEANYEATARLVEAARSAGVGSFVYISSVGVHGFGSHVDSDEKGPYYPLRYPYQITKKLAEDYALSRDAPGFRVTALRPCNVYGPGDITSTYAMYDAIMSGFFGYIGSGKALTCPIYIDDLCEGVLAALDRGECAGEAIILGDGQKVSWRDYARVMFEAVGSRKRPVSMPKPIAYSAAAAMTGLAKALRSPKAPMLTMYRVVQGSHDYHFSNAKARELLGFSPKVFYEEGLQRTARSYMDARLKRLARRG
jgi:nucleoside-diphosphate-sugar epimerase